MNVDNVLGFFGQDSWTVGRNLTLNLGMRFDHNTGILPAQSTTGGPFVPARSIAESSADLSRTSSSGAPGLSYDPCRATARPRSRRATAATGCRSASIACSTSTRSSRHRRPVRGPIRTTTASPSRASTARAAAASRALTISYAGANGPRWPYSDEVTAGVERETDQGHARRRDVLLPHQPRSDRHAQHGGRRRRAYAPFTVTVPNGPAELRPMP